MIDVFAWRMEWQFQIIMGCAHKLFLCYHRYQPTVMEIVLTIPDKTHSGLFFVVFFL